MRWHRATLRVLLVLVSASWHSAGGRQLGLHDTRHRHMEQDGVHLVHGTHHTKTAALDWLADDANLLPQLAAEHWAENLIIGYTAGYSFEALKPFVYSFLGHVDEPTQLVLLTPDSEIAGLPSDLGDRVVVQRHGMPTDFPAEDLPYHVSLRFHIAAAFLRATRHSGSTLFADTRDVFLQRDPFGERQGHVLHFPKESSAYRIKGPYTANAEWLLQCYSEEEMRAIGGMPVLNSGTLLGPSQLLARYFDLMTAEFRSRWHCMRLHGSDQAVHNHLIYSGAVAAAGIEFQIDDQTTGEFAFVAYTHPNVWEFRDVGGGRRELYNREGTAFAAIHLWPGDNPVANDVVLPYVAEMESARRRSSQPGAPGQAAPEAPAGDE